MNTWYAYSSLHRTYIGNNHTPKLNSMNAILHLIAARIGQIKAMRCSASHAANSRIFAFVRIVTLLRPLCLPHSKQKMAQKPLYLPLKHPKAERNISPQKRPSTPPPKNISSHKTTSSAQENYGRQVKATTVNVRNFLQNNYNLRYNVVDGTAEICDRVGGKELFRPITPVRLNTIVLQLHKKGIPAWDRDVTRILQSFTLKQYHPLNDFLTHLPTCDGTDRLTPLAKRISDDALWIRVFYCRMRGMVIQQQACLKDIQLDTEDKEEPTVTTSDRENAPSNQLAPILISHEQGMHKSTFCRLLLPRVLSNYFTDKFDLTSRFGLEFSLCRYALINLDEFDRYSPAQMAKLKNLMQLSSLNVSRPRTSRFETMQRTASFIGTSNTTELLTDPSGSQASTVKKW